MQAWGFALALTLAMAPVPAIADAPTRSEVLYSVSGESAQLHKTGPHRYRLAVRAVDPHTVWFTDRPARDSGVMRTRTLARQWDATFGDDPPNVALVLHRPTAGTDTVVAVARNPRVRGRSLHLRLRVLTQRQAGRVTGPLAGHARRHDTHIPAATGDLTLFIDGVDATVINGCLLAPETVCWQADLRAADMHGLDLHKAHLGDCDLTGANLAGTNLRNAELSRSTLSSANLTNANLAFADLTATAMSGVHAQGADLSGADLSGRSDLRNADFGNARMGGVMLFDADLTGANLSGANLTNASLLRATTARTIFTGALLSNAVMPDGTQCQLGSVGVCRPV